MLNNVAIGAAYAKYQYRTSIKYYNSLRRRRVAIVDTDVHRGRGTEAIVRNLRPSSTNYELPQLHTAFAFSSYKPW